MASITTRAGKGSPLTNAEVDANFTNLNTELGQKLVAASNLSDLGSAATARTNLGLAIGTNVQAWDADLDAIAALAGTAGLLRKTAANTWSLDTATYLTGNQSISVSGDASGSGTTAISLTLANSGVTAGTYTKVTVDAKGRVTVGASLASADLPTYTGTLTSSQVTTALGFTPYNSTNPNGYITSSALSSYLPLTGGTISTTNSTGSLAISDAGTSGANLKLTGNGATTPSKTIRAFSGNLSIVNNAYSAEIFTLSDAGVITNSTWNGATVGVAYGGTGATTLTGLVKGNGTSAFTAAVAGTDYVVPSALTSYAPLASPTFTGTPAAPTAAVDTNTTQIATTAYVIGQGYLKSATASSTYQTISGMSSYLTTATAASTYLPLAGGTLTGNLTFSGSNLRITGDFTSATRMYVQTSTANGNTFFAVLPNGTSTNSQLQVFGSSDPSNASYGTMTINASALQIQSVATGTGTLLPFRIMMSSTEAMRVSTAANVLIGTITDNATDKLQVAGTGNFTGAVTAASFTGNASSASRWATARTQSLTGDVTGSASVDGSANWSITTTLANSGVVAGTYNNVTVNAKGLVTGGSNVSYLTGNQSITVSGDASGSGTTAISLTLANSGVTAGTYTKVTVDAKGRVTTGASLASADLPTYTGTLTSGQVTTALGFTPYNSTNPSGYITTGAANTFTATQTFSGTSSTLGAVLNDVAEVATVSATAATGTIAYDVTTQSVLFYTTNASGNFTVNFRGSSGTSLNTLMSTGQSLTVAFLVTNGATAFFNNAVQVDGTTTGVTTRWQGGTAPAAGNASSVDAYVYSIIKTANATFSVFAAQTRFA
ncbi:MAG: hypothetical protein RL745_984 [Actinomycetota bacterium]|jgi:phage-related tail fiber protein